MQGILITKTKEAQKSTSRVILNLVLSLFFRSNVASIWAANAKQTLMDGRRNYDMQIRETTLCKFDV